MIMAFALAGFSAFAQSTLKMPNVSANALFLYRNSNFAKENTSEVRNGIDIQEAEVAFYADVDPYSRLNVLLSVHPEYTADVANDTVTQEWVIEPEEAYAETDRIPSTTLRIGKFKAAFGKHNPLHTHAFPFVDAPVVNSALLGSEGLNDVGVSAAVLLPFGWFSEVTGQYLRGEGENEEFNSATPGDGVGVGHWKNLWDLSDSMTMEAGASYAFGNNSLGGDTSLIGADLTFKWRPVAGGKYHSWILGSEYIRRDLAQPGAKTELGQGFDVWGQYQMSERWSALLRFDHLDVSESATPATLPNVTTRKYSGALVFGATEFSSYRVEYNQAEGPSNADGESVERKVYLQANFTIGAHPVHAY
jgi:hypothetical protein